MRSTYRKKNNMVLIAGLLIAVSLALTTYSAKNKNFVTTLNQFYIQLTAPVQKLNYGIGKRVTSAKDQYVNLISIKNERDELLKKVRNLELSNFQLYEYKLQNNRLKSLLRVKRKNKLTGITSVIIGYSNSEWSKFITIDRGETNNIEVGMPVISSKGAVGQVTAVSANTSRVQLITDPSSGVDALLQDDRTRVTVEGNGEDECELKYLTREEKIEIGEKIVTSGSDGVFPKGILIGHVATFDTDLSGMFKPAKVKPAVDFNKLEEVLVVTK